MAMAAAKITTGWRRINFRNPAIARLAVDDQRTNEPPAQTAEIRACRREANLEINSLLSAFQGVMKSKPTVMRTRGVQFIALRLSPVNASPHK